MATIINGFNSRKSYFDGIGTVFTGTQDCATALKLSGLDYTVVKKPLQTVDGIDVPNHFATVREDTNKVIGVVGNQYKVVQNIEGFDFIDELIGEGAQIECAGELANNGGCFIVAQTDPISIMGDDFSSHILFTNSHNGFGAVKAMFTPIRVVCQNGMVSVGKAIGNQISIRHTRSANERLSNARRILIDNTAYSEYIKNQCEDMYKISFTKSQYETLVEKLIPIKADASAAVIERALQSRDAMLSAYEVDDVQNFRGTAYQSMLAISDYESHIAPTRNTGNDQVYMQRVMAGMTLLNAAIAQIQLMTGVSLN